VSTTNLKNYTLNQLSTMGWKNIYICCI